MQRIKIYALTSIAIIVLLGLSIGLSEPTDVVGSEMTISTSQTKNESLDPKKTVLYHWQQQQLKKAIEAYFDKAIASGEIVGAGVSIVKGDSIVIAEGFGQRNIKNREKVNGQTIFRLGSLSKGFTGLLTANIIEQGILDWDDKVQDFIPEFQLGDHQNTNKITLANILSHTSGAPYHSFTNLIEAGLPLAEIAGRFKEVRPISKPGEIYSYQNALFALSDEIISKATGQDITKLLQTRIFNPLGMCAASMDYESLVNSENVALPHSKWRSGWRPKKLNDHYYNAISAGGISANAMDMGKWMRFVLGHNPEIMGERAIKEAFKPVVEIKGRSKYYQRWPGHVSSHYGFGWRIHKYVERNTRQEKTIWHHGGSVNNFRNEIAVFPEADLGICVLLNSPSPLARRVIPDLYKIVREVYKVKTTNIASNDFTEAYPPL